MRREELGINGIEEIAIIKSVNSNYLRLSFENGMEGTIYNHPQLEEAFRGENTVRVISTSSNLGANILAIGHISEDKWYKV